MPPLWCRLDRLWFGHPGVLEGSITRQPFLCPLDHVFEVITLVALETFQLFRAINEKFLLFVLET